MVTLHIPADNTSQYYFEAIPVAGNWVPNTGQNFGISFIEASVYNSGQLPSNYFPGIGSVPGQSGWSDGRSSNKEIVIVQGAFTPISGFGVAFRFGFVVVTSSSIPAEISLQGKPQHSLCPLGKKQLLA